MKFFIGIVLSICYVGNTAYIAQNKGGRIYFIRPYSFVESAIPFNIYIDDTLVCKIKNKKFSIHEVQVGEHSITARNNGLSSHKPTEPVTVKAESGKDVYIKLSLVNEKIEVKEMTEFSAEYDLKKLKPMDRCLKD